MLTRLHRRALPLIATGAIVAATAGGAAPAAKAADQYGPTGVSNVKSGKQLDMRGASTSPGATAIQYHATGWGGLFVGDNQRWSLPYHDTTGPTQITNYHSGLCLATDGVAGHALYQDYCSGSSRQQWMPHSQWVWSNAAYSTYLQNPATGLVIDVNQASTADSAPVIGWYYNGGTNQLWDY